MWLCKDFYLIVVQQVKYPGIILKISATVKMKNVISCW